MFILFVVCSVGPRQTLLQWKKQPFSGNLCRYISCVGTIFISNQKMREATSNYDVLITCLFLLTIYSCLSIVIALLLVALPLCIIICCIHRCYLLVSTEASLLSAIPEAVLSVNLCNELEQSILEENVKCCECIQNDWLSIRIGADEIKIHSLIAKKSSDCPKPALIWIHGFGGTGAISFGL